MLRLAFNMFFPISKGKSVEFTAPTHSPYSIACSQVSGSVLIFLPTIHSSISYLFALIELIDHGLQPFFIDICRLFLARRSLQSLILSNIY